MLIIIILFLSINTIFSQTIPYLDYHKGSKIIKRRGLVLNNTFHKEWKYYSKEGKLQAIGNWDQGKKQGEWKFFYENGKLRMKGEYDNDKKNGKWKTYDSYSGVLYTLTTYAAGKKNGSYKQYANGKVEISGSYKNDIPSDKWTEYATYEEIAGNELMVVEFNSTGDKAVVIRNFFNYHSSTYNTDYSSSNGEDPYFFDPYKSECPILMVSKEETSYKNGMYIVNFIYINSIGDGMAMYHGRYKSYYEDGQVHCEGDIENGYKQNEWVYYYPNGNLWMKCQHGGNIGSKSWTEETTTGSISHSRSYRIGPYELYYENGNLKEKGEYNNVEEKIGVWKYYNEDGSLKESIDYSKRK